MTDKEDSVAVQRLLAQISEKNKARMQAARMKPGAVLDSPGDAETRLRYSPTGLLAAEILRIVRQAASFGLATPGLIAQRWSAFWADVTVDGRIVTWERSTRALWAWFAWWLLSVVFLVAAAWITRENWLLMPPLLGLGLVAGGAASQARFRAQVQTMKIGELRLHAQGSDLAFGLRVLLWSLPVLATAGLLLPLAQMQLGLWRADRVQFGMLPVRLERARWTQALPAWIPAWLCLLSVILLVLDPLALFQPVRDNLYAVSAGILLTLVTAMLYRLSLLTVTLDQMVVGDRRLVVEPKLPRPLWGAVMGAILMVGTLVALFFGAFFFARWSPLPVWPFEQAVNRANLGISLDREILQGYLAGILIMALSIRILAAIKLSLIDMQAVVEILRASRVEPVGGYIPKPGSDGA